MNKFYLVNVRIHKAMKIIVIIPVLNEEKAIGKVINDIPTSLTDEIIVVDNGSSDNTSLIAEKSGARLVFEKRKGYGSACLAGVRAAKNADVIVFVDGDYSDYPEDMGKIIQPILEDQADMVIGSRLLGQREKGALPVHSLFGNWLAAKLINYLYKVKITDLGPFRAIKNDVLKQLNLKEITYGFPVEMIVKAAKKKIRIREIPMRYRKRLGQSKITGTVKGSILSSYYILKIILKFSYR